MPAKLQRSAALPSKPAPQPEAGRYPADTAIEALMRVSSGRRFSSNDVVRFFSATITLRKLQWWDERKIFQPSFHLRHRRSYGWDDMVVVGVIQDLVKRGISLGRVRRSLREVNKAIRNCDYRYPEFLIVDTDPFSRHRVFALRRDEHPRALRLMSMLAKDAVLVHIGGLTERLFERFKS